MFLFYFVLFSADDLNEKECCILAHERVNVFDEDENRGNFVYPIIKY